MTRPDETIQKVLPQIREDFVAVNVTYESLTFTIARSQMRRWPSCDRGPKEDMEESLFIMDAPLLVEATTPLFLILQPHGP